MTGRILKIALSALAALFFLFLAFRDVDLQDLAGQILQVRLYWILPFTVCLLASHWFRALRWELYLPEMDIRPSRVTLFAGVMVGYTMNYVFPRLGEISRPVYVASQTGGSSSSLLGTIVLERVIDLLFLILFLMFISFWHVSDRRLISEIFGTDGWSAIVWFVIPALTGFLFLALWGGIRLLRRLHGAGFRNRLLVRLLEFADLFWSGLTTIRRLEHWGRFLLYTLAIWAGYTLMAWLPFYMLDLQADYGLGLIEAMIITIISAVGVAVPTPGGIGSYHLFVQQSLWLLYSVPLVPALTYATVTHAVTLVVVFLSTAVVLWFNKYYTLKEKIVR